MNLNEEHDPGVPQLEARMVWRRAVRWPDRIRLRWDARDIWVGVFWRADAAEHHAVALEVFVCILPCVPLHLLWFKRWFLTWSAEARADAEEATA